MKTNEWRRRSQKRSPALCNLRNAKISRGHTAAFLQAAVCTMHYIAQHVGKSICLDLIPYSLPATTTCAGAVRNIPTAEG